MQSFTVPGFSLLFFSLCCNVCAQTQLRVEVGWGMPPRTQRWTPVFVTASSEKTRNVDLVVEWPLGGDDSMRVRQAMTIGAARRTFPLLLPVHGWEYQQAMFTLVDRDSGKSLAHFPNNGNQALIYGGTYQSGTEFVGVSGETATLASLQQAAGSVNIGYLEPRRISTAALGFEGLNLLVLNEPNLRLGGYGSAPLDNTQQQAIVDWVSGGGTLILWPGDGGLPSTGPLGDKLPATVGGRDDLTLSPADLSALGMAPRYKNPPSFHLEPKPHARRIALLNAGQISAYAARLGLGQIVLVPVNLAELQIDDAGHSRNLWRPLVKGIISFPGDSSTKPPDSPGIDDPAGMQPAPAALNVYNDGINVDQTREKRASMQIGNFLGNVPDERQTRYSDIACVLFGLMLVVGPIDWLVLKRLGRRPWTLSTTGGCIVLIIAGAIFAGDFVRSGGVQYKTVRTIDQAGDYSIASTDYIALDSSRGRTFKIKTDPESWWQPTGFTEFARTGMMLDTDFHQSSLGNTPEAIVTNVSSPRYLRGDHTALGAPILSANLKIKTSHDGTGAVQVAGVITNLSDLPLKNISVQTDRGVCELSLHEPTPAADSKSPASLVEISPHASATVDGLLIQQTPAKAGSDSGRYDNSSSPPAIAEGDLWKAAADLNIRRGGQMSQRIATGRYAIVYAESVNPPAAATLLDRQAVEKHWQFIRALVELNATEEK